MDVYTFYYYYSYCFNERHVGKQIFDVVWFVVPEDLDEIMKNLRCTQRVVMFCCFGDMADTSKNL